jgi:uncharacterized membrane protein YuzA (DUF378 family)
MNKKAETTLSTITYTVLVGLTVMVLFSAVTIKMSSNFNKVAPTQFSGYDSLLNESNGITNEMIKSQDSVDELNQTKPTISNLVTVMTNYWSESWIYKAYQTIKIPFKYLKLATKSINQGLDDIIYIPQALKWLIMGIVAIAILFAIVKAYLERRI